MARFSWTTPKPRSVTQDVPITSIIGGSPTSASKVDVYAKPAITKVDDTVGYRPTPTQYQNKVDYVSNLFSEGKINTLDDYDNLIASFTDKKLFKERNFGPAHPDLETGLKNIRNILNNKVGLEGKNYINIWKELGKKSLERAGGKGKEAVNVTLFDNYVQKLKNIKTDVEGDQPLSLYDAMLKQVALPTGTDRSNLYTLKNLSWNKWKEQLRTGTKEQQELYNYFKKDMGPQKQKVLLDDSKLTGTDYAYKKTFTKKYTPEQFATIKNAKIREFFGIDPTTGKGVMTALHKLGKTTGFGDIAQIKKLVSKYEMIPPKFINEISRPTYIGTKKMNDTQRGIELGPGRGGQGLIDILVEKYKLMGYNFKKFDDAPGGEWIYTKPTTDNVDKINALTFKITKLSEKLADGGMETVFYNPAKDHLVYFGKTDPNLSTFYKEWKVGNRKEGGLVKPNMAYGGDMAQFTEMESVVPELNPNEAGTEDYTQLAMSIPKFRNPFKKVEPPSIMSDAPSGLKIADKTKAGAKVEGTIKTEGKAPIFHLKSDMELINAVQDKMTPQQWLGYLKKKGVSETEMHEFGLGNLIKNIGGWDEGTKKWKNNKSISKSDLIAAYNNEKPVITYKIQQIEPFDKGVKDFASFISKRKSGGSYFHGESGLEDIRGLMNKPQDIAGDTMRKRLMEYFGNNQDFKKDWMQNEKAMANDFNKIYKQFYGIDNVVENGIPEGMKIPFYSQNLLNRFNRLRKGEGFTMGKTGVSHEGAQFLSGGTGYIEIPFTYNPNPKGARANEPKFSFGEGHFTNPKGNNPVFWLRASERVDEQGKRVFLIEEIQSDMHQKVKQRPNTFKYSQRHDTPEFINKTLSLSQVKKLKADLVKVSDQIDKITGHTDPSAVTIMERLKVKREALRKQIMESEDLIMQAGKSDEVFPEGPWKKSENQAKVSFKTLINLATQQGFDSIAIITGKAKNHATNASSEIAKGNIGFYDNIAPSAMKSVAKNSGLEFSSTNIKDGKGNTWAKIPTINLKKEPVTTSVDMYKAQGGYIHRPSFVDVVPVL